MEACVRGLGIQYKSFKISILILGNPPKFCWFGFYANCGTKKFKKKTNKGKSDGDNHALIMIYILIQVKEEVKAMGDSPRVADIANKAEVKVCRWILEEQFKLPTEQPS